MKNLGVYKNMNDSVCCIVMLRDFDDAIPRRCRLFVVITAHCYCATLVYEKNGMQAGRAATAISATFSGSFSSFTLDGVGTAFFYYVKFDKAKF